jgi:hypothetical protein
MEDQLQKTIASFKASTLGIKPKTPIPSKLSIPSIPNVSSIKSLPSELTTEIEGAVQTSENKGWLKWIILIIILALLGFNIFTYFGEILNWLKRVLSPIFGPVVGTTAEIVGDTAKQTIDITAKGAKGAITGVQEVSTSGISALQDVLEGKRLRNGIDGVSVDKELSDAEAKFVFGGAGEADETDNMRPKSKKGKVGYCYVGEDKGFRTCISVNKAHECMSGEIFPTMDVCVNPSLRV